MDDTLPISLPMISAHTPRVEPALSCFASKGDNGAIVKTFTRPQKKSTCRLTIRILLLHWHRMMMLEGQAVAEALGIQFAINVDKRIEGGAEVGRHKTSMLQNLEQGRPFEIDAIPGAVIEMAEWTGMPVPISQAILPLVRQRATLRISAS